jgi:uncharacterized protein YbjT (DUF2867 family)
LLLLTEAFVFAADCLAGAEEDFSGLMFYITNSERLIRPMRDRLSDKNVRRREPAGTSADARPPSQVPATMRVCSKACHFNGPTRGRYTWRLDMKIVVIGGSGLIGTKLVKRLRQNGHEVVAASRASGVNTLTGEGLAEALAGATVVVDVANSPSFEDKAVLEFFETTGRNILAAEAAAGVGHHVALSVVGTERLLASGYFRAKMAQENLIKASKIPYTIVRATQFFEFVGSIAQAAIEGETVRLPPALMQPVVSDDVAEILADIAVEQPLNGTVELAGPEPIRMDDLVRRFLSANSDSRKVTTDVDARYYGTEVNDQSLTPGPNPRLGSTQFGEWLAQTVPKG